jgi:hypothetical protein
MTKTNLIMKIRLMYNIQIANIKKVFSKIYILTAIVSLFNFGHANVRTYNTELVYSKNSSNKITVCYTLKPFETGIAHSFHDCLSITL